MSEAKRTRLLFVLPALAFLGVAGALAFGLGRDASTLPSALLEKPAPDFALPPLAGRDEHGFARKDLGGEFALVNVWASWCGPCRVEHPVLRGLAERGLTVHGLNCKDQPDEARAFLDQLGDEFTHLGVDPEGKAAIDWGVYGVPETFVVDPDGVIVHKHVGPLMPRDLEKTFLPAMRAAGWREGGASDGEAGGEAPSS